VAACQVPQSIKLEHIQRRNTLRKTGHVKEPEQMIPCLEMSELDTWYILIPLQSFTILYVRFFFVLGKRHGLGWGPLGSLGGLLVPVIFWDWLYARNQPPRRAAPLSCLRKKMAQNLPNVLELCVYSLYFDYVELVILHAFPVLCLTSSKHVVSEQKRCVNSAK
jgi:hypothetical protein